MHCQIHDCNRPAIEQITNSNDDKALCLGCLQAYELGRDNPDSWSITLEDAFIQEQVTARHEEPQPSDYALITAPLNRKEVERLAHLSFDQWTDDDSESALVIIKELHQADTTDDERPHHCKTCAHEKQIKEVPPEYPPDIPESIIDQANRLLVNLDGDWPEDEWYLLTPEWTLNIWYDNPFRLHAQLYPVHEGQTLKQYPHELIE